jgi:eukaryotic-like serine/threonine-protein kinase
MRDVRTSDGTQATPAGRDVIAGKYRLVSVLGQGGMGTVWLAEHLGLDAPVAIKLIDPKASGGAEALRLCQKEASAAAALRSPHVVQVLDFGMDDATGSPFIVMELLEGDSLADRLHRLGALSPADTARVMTHVARALSRAHEVSIVHRDLKPANVFLVRNEDEELAKVLDFGTARVQRASGAGGTGGTGGTSGLTGATTPTGAVIGTPFYMSPEHITGQLIDHRTDLWAMAVMAFECLTGRRPFDAKDIGQLVLQICTYPIVVPSQVARVPAGFDDWFARATRREIEQRFRSAREMVDDLRQICGGAAPGSPDGDAEPVAPRTLEMGPATLPAPIKPTRRRRGWWIAASAAVVGAVVAVAATGGLFRRAATPPAANAVPTTPEATAPAAPRGPAPVAGNPAGLPPAPAPPPALAPPPRAQAERRPVRRKPQPTPTPTPTAVPAVAPAEPPRAQPSPMLESVLDHRR